MGIADIFRPRHRHSDASIRVDAVDQLTHEDTDLLSTIAKQDQDPSGGGPARRHR